MTPKFHLLKIADIRQETEDTVSIEFAVPSHLVEDYKFVAGQYLTLKSDISGEEVRRSYSLCSAPFENSWRVAVKQVPNGKFSTYANTSLKVGQELEVMTPTGHFQLPTQADKTGHYVFFAAGSGITPVFSMMKEVLKKEPNSEVTLFFGNKGFASIIFREEIEALKNLYMNRLRVIHVLSRESLGNTIQKGRIDLAKVKDLYRAFLQNVQIDGVYVCGPESMIHAVKDGLTEAGIDAHAIHFELFGTEIKSADIPKYSGPQVDANVQIIMDGELFEMALDGAGPSILEAAQQAGADVPFACKGGVCCTCKAKIIEGEARMDVNYALEPDEVDAGYILTCQAHPTTEKLVISFDD